jgi:hypothetical protein
MGTGTPLNDAASGRTDARPLLERPAMSSLSVIDVITSFVGLDRRAKFPLARPALRLPERTGAASFQLTRFARKPKRDNC